MPNYTANYNLQKPTPEEFYDVGVQNNNMDVIDGAVKGVEDDLASLGADLEQHKLDYVEQRSQDQLKVAKVEKELSDYKAAIAGININQEAKQVVSGYGVVSLPPNAANGQVSVSVKGLTYNQLVKNGNFKDGVSYWNKWYSSNSFSNGVLINTGDGTHQVPNVYSPPFKRIANNKYFIKVVWRVTNSSCNLFFVTGFGTSLTVNNPIQNQWYTTKEIVTPTTGSDSGIIQLNHSYVDATTANGKMMEVAEIVIVNLTIENDTESDLDKLEQKYKYVDNTKSTVGAMRLKSVSADETETSTAYVTAKDSEGKIALLRSVPSAKDEIRLVDGKMVKRVSDEYILDHSWFKKATTNNPEGFDMYWAQNLFTIRGLPVGLIHTTDPLTATILSVDGVLLTRVKNWGSLRSVGEYATETSTGGIVELVVPTGQTIESVYGGKTITLTYQLANPVEIPIQVSGNIVSHPSGTIYVDPATTAAGIYNAGISVTEQELNIKELEKISKIDFATGLETQLDVTKAVIAEDRLSFTHPDLIDGDIVFFEYVHDIEGTIPETEIEYYDSRYTIKDSVTDKFYKWNVTVADGVPGIGLVEV